MKPPRGWKAEFEKYLQTLPVYYVQVEATNVLKLLTLNRCVCLYVFVLDGIEHIVLWLLLSFSFYLTIILSQAVNFITSIWNS